MIVRVRATDIEILQGDMTALDVAAVVNPAAPDLQMSAGLAGAIKSRGGDSIENEARESAPLAPGEAVMTGAGGLTPHKIIHAVSVDGDGRTSERIIRRACASALNLAAREGLSSIALPALGCGTGGFPPVASAKIIAQEALRHGRYHDAPLKRIVVCLYDKEFFRLFEQTILGYINHVQDDLGNGPYVTVDVIIERPDGIVMIERSNPPFGWALPGGFVDVGESVETAAAREAREETGLDLEDLRQFHVYSDPDRDPRFHTVSTVFVATGRGDPQFGSDARGLAVIPREELLNREYAFDHKQVIEDYLKHGFRMSV